MIKKRKSRKSEPIDADTLLLATPPKKKTIDKEILKMSAASLRVGLERELRRYIKRSGGFRKDLSSTAKKRAEAIMEKLGRKEKKWDFNIVVPGYDAPTVKGMFIAD